MPVSQHGAVDVASLPDRYVPPEVAAEFLNIKPQTLATWRTLDVGPKYSKLSSGRSGAIRYSLRELAAFAADPTGYRPRPVATFRKPAPIQREGQRRLPVAKARRRRGKGVSGT